VLRYRKRMNKYINDQLNAPKVVHKYFEPKARSIRDVIPSKWLGRGIMITKGFESEAKRIEV
jgi:hypothetical protein